jgi:hypothetical protein
MGHEQVAEAITCPAFGHGLIYLGSDINNGKPVRGLNFEFDHIVKFTSKRCGIPPLPKKDNLCPLVRGSFLTAWAVIG